MLYHSAAQVLTITNDPQRGNRLGEVGVITDGGVLFRSGKIVETGRSKDLLKKYPGEEKEDFRGKVIMPGFVDPHTHVIWAGDRSAEFEMRLQGKSYLEIMEAGGGIVSTVKATRAAALEDIKEETRTRIRNCLSLGTTTLEAKTGYGLDTETELRMIQALLELDQEEPIDIVITFLGAHAVPQEYSGRTGAYTDLVCEEMIPALGEWWPKQTKKSLPFVDVFCEKGAFDLDQSRRILETAREHGFPLKIHADEFENLGGARLAAEMGAASADHLVVTSSEDIESLGGSNTVAVGLPCTPFGLGDSAYTPAEAFLESDALLAIATDLNPGTAWCESMQFAIALACRYMKLTPDQAIAAATINAAAAIGMNQNVGSLDPGKQADLLVLDIPDYRHIGYRFGTNLVGRVVKRGKVVV
jgi:imidazolonepropionase